MIFLCSISPKTHTPARKCSPDNSWVGFFPDIPNLSASVQEVSVSENKIVGIPTTGNASIPQTIHIAAINYWALGWEGLDN